jgi:hypothetical protein
VSGLELPGPSFGYYRCPPFPFCPRFLQLNDEHPPWRFALARRASRLPEAQQLLDGHFAEPGPQFIEIASLRREQNVKSGSLLAHIILFRWFSQRYDNGVIQMSAEEVEAGIRKSTLMFGE